MLQGYCDVASLGVLPAHTSGSLYHWAPWSPELDADEFYNDLRWCCVRPQVRGGEERTACLAGFLLLPLLSGLTALLCPHPSNRLSPRSTHPPTRREQGLETVGRLRCSKGLAVEKYIGALHRRVATDVMFPALSCDHAFAAKLTYEVGGGVMRCCWGLS